MGAINFNWHGCRFSDRSTGALVSGAAVTLTDTTTNVARSTTTNTRTDTIIYVNMLNPGIYNIAVSKAGFETTNQKYAGRGGKSQSQPNGQLNLRVGGPPRCSVVVEVLAVGQQTCRP